MPSLSDFFLDALREATFAARQMPKLFARMALAAESDVLRQNFARQAAAGPTQQLLLREVFRLSKRPARIETSGAILGLLQDGEEFLDTAPGAGPLQDVKLIALGQALAHDRMPRYGVLAAWAEALGQPEAARLLRQAREEERTFDEALEGLAGVILPSAV